MKSLFAILLMAASFANAQTVTGSVSGAILDSSGSALPASSVRLVSNATGAVRETRSGESGDFVFNAIPPGEYVLEIERPGFKKFQKTAISLTASENLALGAVRLELGYLTESVTVVAEGSAVQLASGERSGIVTSEQVENLTIINRDFAALVALVPGIVYEPGNEVQGSSGSIYALGGRGGSNNVTVDGQPADNVNPYGRNMFISQDSVSTVRIMVSNYQAEFGRKPGAAVQAVTKSGTKDFHGAGFFYKRHDMLNANQFFNNRSGVVKPIQRYTSGGFTIGGPLYVPGRFNRNKEKLFFFFAHEQFQERRPQAIRQVTVPTALEKQGDFSNSRDLNGALMTVVDPLANRAAFPGNKVPAARILPYTQAFLNTFPLPNYLDTAISLNRYNYQAQESLDVPKHTETVRTDYLLSPKTTIYGRFNYWWQDNRGWAVPAGNSNWGWFPNHYNDVTRSGVLSMSHIASPSTVIEASLSVSLFTEDGMPTQEQIDLHRRDKTGALIPQLYPQNNPLNLLPQSSFGGVNAAISTGYEGMGRFPIHGREVTFVYSGTMTRTHGTHVSKAGIMAERWRSNKGEFGNFAGTINFSRDTANPNDANHPFANSLLGNFSSYTESTSRPSLYERAADIEWYVQDNWKVRRNLTLDFGLRMGWGAPWKTHRPAEAGFVPERWNSKQVVSLAVPALVGGKRVALNPLTGEVLPLAALGAIVPGSGNSINGIVQETVDTNYPRGLRPGTGINFSPRVGFAWDPLGSGKTVVRGGFGIFNDVHTISQGGNSFFTNPPNVLNPTIYYGNLANLTSAANYVFPSNVTGIARYYHAPYTMNYSFGLQRRLKFNTVIDVAYVGAVTRHLQWAQNLNAVPFGTDFLPSSLDASNGNRPLSAAFLRPYIGYNTITWLSNGGTSNYNSLQVSASRQFARKLEFGGSWTWSKAMDYVDTETAAISTLVAPRVWNYGKAGFDRAHVLKINWVWTMPKGSALWNNALMKAVADGWQLSGIASFVSGAPSGLSVSLTSTSDITGSPTDGARVNLIADPRIPRADRTFGYNFNTNAFGPPAIGTPGNAAKDLVRGPGISNFDLSLFKRIPLPNERFKLQFRAEGYNALNHTQFSSFDTGARFDATGKQINAGLSQYTAARLARRMQLALRLTF